LAGLFSVSALGGEGNRVQELIPKYDQRSRFPHCANLQILETINWHYTQGMNFNIVVSEDFM
jgi:hypothetical protein